MLPQNNSNSGRKLELLIWSLNIVKLKHTHTPTHARVVPNMMRLVAYASKYSFAISSGSPSSASAEIWKKVRILIWNCQQLS
jgi:hypothetical protein